MWFIFIAKINTMKKLITLFALPLLFMLSSMSGCEKDEDEDITPEEVKLHVEFTNSTGSKYTISIMQLRPHGKAGEADSPAIGDWGANILPAGTTIAPGETHIMDLPIPNLYWDEYRLGVINTNGQTIMLHEQEGWNSETGPPITHWGGDNRMCDVTVVYNESRDLIVISAWGDWAY